MPKGGNIATAATSVSAPVGGTKAGPAVSVRSPEMGFGGNVATQFNSRGLEAFRNPTQAGAKMRIDSFGKPVGTSSAKSEFSRSGATGPQRSETAYASSSDFSKSPEFAAPKTTITTQLKPAPESNASQSSSFRPVTASDLQRFGQQASQEAQKILGDTLPAGTEVKGQVEVRNNSVKIVSIDKPQSSTDKKVEPTVANGTEAKNPDTPSLVKSEAHVPTQKETAVMMEPLQVAPGMELSGDTQGILSAQEVKNLVQQSAYTGEAKPLDIPSQEMKDSVRRLPDITTKKAEEVISVEQQTVSRETKTEGLADNVLAVKESETGAERKSAIQQELQQIEKQQTVEQAAQPSTQSVVKTSETQIKPVETNTSSTVGQGNSAAKTETEPQAVSEVQNVNETANVFAQKVEQPATVEPTSEIKPVAENPTASPNRVAVESVKPYVEQPGEQSSKITKETTLTGQASVLQETKQETASKETEDTVSRLQEVTPVNPAEKASVVIADVPSEEKALQGNEARTIAFQKELLSIKEQVAGLTETASVETRSLQTTEAITVLPDAKPLPVPEVTEQAKTSGAEFGNLLKKRQKEKLAPLSVSNPEPQAQARDKAEAVTVKVQRKSFLKGFLQVKVRAAAEKAKEKTQQAVGYVGKYTEVIDWDEILRRKKKKSAYEEITGKTSVVDAILKTQQVAPIQETSKSSAQQASGVSQSAQLVVESVSVLTSSETASNPAPPVLNAASEQQQETLAQVLPNTQPVTVPEQVQQLHNQSEQAASETLGTAGIVIFSANKTDGPINLILDKEAKQARQKALENGVRNARMTPDGTMTGADVVAAAGEKHTTPLISGAAKALGIPEDGSEITLWNAVGSIEELPQREMIARALHEENNLRPVAVGENGSRADEKDLALVLSNVKKREELGLAA